MIDIRHRIGINAPQDQVLQAVSTIDGIGSWWTTYASGDAAPGGKMDFGFGSKYRHLTLETVEVTPDRVEWRCIEGPDEWMPTRFSFDLTHDDGETVVMFAQSGWTEEVPFTAHCSLKWASYLLSLKQLVEDGEGAPFPRDLHISSWD